VRSSRIRDFLQRYGLVVSFLILCIVLSFLSDRFLTVGNLTNVLRQSTINLIIAIGMTYVILIAGIDLSVGAVLALSTVVTADLLQRGVPIVPTILLGLTLGGVLGMASGLLISRVKVPPFVATLGMMTVARGLALTYTQGRPITGLPDAFRYIGTGFLGPIPMPIIVAAVAFIAGYLLLTRTRMGMNIYALGNNPIAAHYTGIATTNYITFVYVLAGALAALAGMILVARLDSAQPTAGISYEFDAIAAVVVGGTSFAGGEGSLLGTLLGVLVISVLNNGLNLLNVSSFYQPVVTGVVIALALLLYKAVR
jgi:ribose/xylose/arabinose/galactoside ABC-type transport system permease subunit